MQLTHSDHTHTNHTYPLCLLANNMAQPSNVGSLFRVADALGIEKIFLTGTSPTPPTAKIRKASRSADKYVPFEYNNDAGKVMTQLKANGYYIVSVEITENSTPLPQLVLPKGAKVCLLVGAENEGVDDTLLAQSDAITHIPMLGNNSSMNVSMACAIATYAITQQLVQA